MIYKRNVSKLKVFKKLGFNVINRWNGYSNCVIIIIFNMIIYIKFFV